MRETQNKTKIVILKKYPIILNNDGIMVFESHPPAIENKEQLDKTLGAIRKIFLKLKKNILKLPPQWISR